MEEVVKLGEKNRKMTALVKVLENEGAEREAREVVGFFEKSFF